MCECVFSPNAIHIVKDYDYISVDTLNLLLCAFPRMTTLHWVENGKLVRSGANLPWGQDCHPSLFIPFVCVKSRPWIN